MIDTAECYLQSEELIGQAVASRRGEFFLFTKCGHPEGPYAEDWRPDSLLQSIRRSLQRLQTDRVDLVQLHSCSEAELRKGDVIAALVRARELGYTRYIGYCGDDQAARYAVGCGAFDALQTSLNIADQQAIDLTLPLARERGMGVIIKRPIANAVWRYAQKPENTYVQPYWERLQKLAVRLPAKATPKKPPQSRWGLPSTAPVCTRRSSARPNPAAGEKTPRCSSESHSHTNNSRPFVPAGAKSPPPTGSARLETARPAPAERLDRRFRVRPELQLELPLC